LCSIASEHTKVEWKFLKVPDRFFRGLKERAKTFEELYKKLKAFLKNSEKLEMISN